MSENIKKTHKTVKRRTSSLKRREKRIKKRTETQRRTREKVVKKKRSFDVDDLIQQIETLHLGKNIELKAAIWGHGRQCRIGEKDAVFKVHDNVQTNILGLGFSGVCNIGNVKLINDIDKMLKTKPGNLSSKNLSYALIKQTEVFIEHQKKLEEAKIKGEGSIPILWVETNNEDLFSYVENYGKDKHRCNKEYGGYKEKDPSLSDQIKNGKVLVRIYNIKIGDEVVNVPHDLYLEDGSSLNDIISHIIDFINKNIMEKITSKQKINNLIIDLFDSTCNYSADTPNIAFTETVKQRNKKGIVRTTATKRVNIMRKTRYRSKSSLNSTVSSRRSSRRSSRSSSSHSSKFDLTPNTISELALKITKIKTTRSSSPKKSSRPRSKKRPRSISKSVSN